MPQHATYAICTEVSAECPVEATTLGYYPNLAANSFFIALFAILLILQLVLGVRTRTWTYTIALAIGSFGEMVGYVGRILLHYNPWSATGFKIEICCLVLAPSFIAAAIYLTLKHVVLYYGPQYSRLKPTLYPWVFIGSDFGSIVLQAIGGGVAAAAGDNGQSRSLLKAGDNLIVAGIAFQVATMAVFGLIILDYLVRYQKAQRRVRENLALEKEEMQVGPGNNQLHPTPATSTTRIKVCISAVVLAYLTVLIRCIYRLPEMAGGWGGPLMQNQNEFMILDGAMISIATIALTVAHPGLFFPTMCRQKKVVT